MNKERMLQLADFIENHVEDRNFSMVGFFVRSTEIDKVVVNKVPVCGTAHCIGGWAVLLFQGYIKLGYNHPNNPEIAQKFLELSDYQANRLFFDWPYDKIEDREDAVRRIREMAETGDYTGDGRG